MSELPFPKNPHYGHGATRRRIHLWLADGEVRGLLSDIFHEMECTITHDGRVVTGISGKMRRIPNTLCPGAPSMLPELIGTPLGISARDYYSDDRIRHHCTHLFDLAFYVISCALSDRPEVCFEALVPDLPGKDAAVTVSAWKDQNVLVEWTIQREKIVAPASLAGKPVCGGFSHWSYDTFSGDELAAALLLSRTCLLARGRAYQIDAWPGEPINRLDGIEGACYAYASQRIKDGHFARVSNVRDFTDGVKEGS